MVKLTPIQKKNWTWIRDWCISSSNNSCNILCFF